MKSPSYHEELAAHLDGQEAPKPHPRTYQHGHPKGDQQPVVTGLTGRVYTVEELSRLCSEVGTRYTHARQNLALLELEQARKEAEQAADARMRELGLADETEGADELIKGSRTGGPLLVAYLALAFIGLVVGFVRGCAS